MLRLSRSFSFQPVDTVTQRTDAHVLHQLASVVMVCPSVYIADFCAEAFGYRFRAAFMGVISCDFQLFGEFGLGFYFPVHSLFSKELRVVRWYRSVIPDLRASAWHRPAWLHSKTLGLLSLAK